MQFTRETLKSTSARFEKALKAHNMELTFSAAQNVWAQIILGKDFSPASANLDRHGHLRAINISSDSIRTQLKIRNRDVDNSTAHALLTEAIGEDLEEVSETMHVLLRVVQMKEKACLTTAVQDIFGLGILEAGKPGYLPVGSLQLGDTNRDEIAWLRENSATVVEIINGIAGIGTKEGFEIFASSHREGEKKSDKTFHKYFSTRIDTTAHALAEKLMLNLDLEDESEWDIDFDSIWDEIFDVFTRLCIGSSWLKPDCDLAETLIDHLAARVRSTLKWIQDLDAEERLENPVKESIEQSIRLSMEKFFDIGAAKKVA